MILTEPALPAGQLFVPSFELNGLPAQFCQGQLLCQVGSQIMAIVQPQPAQVLSGDSIQAYSIPASSMPQAVYSTGFQASPMAGQVVQTDVASCTGMVAAPFVYHGQPPEQRSVFFAGVTPIVTSETLTALFSQFGTVLSINLFKPWAGSKTSKGCGLVVFNDRQGAAAALEALNGKFHWPGARGPMVVEWMDVSKQHKKARAQPLSYPTLQQHQMMAFQRCNSGIMPGQLCTSGQLFV